MALHLRRVTKKLFAVFLQWMQRGALPDAWIRTTLFPFFAGGGGGEKGRRNSYRPTPRRRREVAERGKVRFGFVNQTVCAPV